VSEALTLNLWNGILPMVVLCALVVVLPGWFSRRDTWSQRALAFAVVKTALVTFAAGALIAAGLYAAINEGMHQQILRDPVGRATFFLGRSALFAMLWGPLLACVWLVRAQELNRRIGMRMVDEGGKG
jgi:hypothetical protein